MLLPFGVVLLQPGPCLENSWSLSYTQGWWKNNYCAGGGPCSGGNPPSTCNMTIPDFSSLPANLQGVLLWTNCTFTNTTNATLTAMEVCGCITPKYNAGQIGNAVAYVLNVLIGRQVTVTNPSGPTDTCPGDTYLPVADTYVCPKPGSTCSCPTTPVSSWDSSVSNECRNLVANAADAGKCLPNNASVELSAVCQLQKCPCTEEIPIPQASPSPSPQVKSLNACHVLHVSIQSISFCDAHLTCALRGWESHNAISAF